MTCGRGSSGRSPDPGRLIGLGYVAPRANPAHRRSVLIALTPSDADVMRRIRADEPRHLAALATDCTQQEIATAAKVLRALDRDVRARAAAPTTPRRDPGEAPIAADAEIYRLTTRDRLMIADVLASFDDTRWYAATLCAG